MMRALILTGFDPLAHTGGIETFTNELVNLLVGAGVQADVCSASAVRNTHGLGNQFLGQVYVMGRKLLALQPGRYDFVVSNGYYGGGFFPKQFKSFTVFHSTHAGYAEALRAHVPVSVYLEIKHVIGEIFEQASAAGSRIIAVSEKVQQELEQYYGIEGIEIIPNPVDTDFFYRLPDRRSLREKYDIPVGRKVGLFVGRWELSKGRDIAGEVISEMRDLFWVVVSASGGDAPPPAGENVLNLSGLQKEEMREIYSLSDFMLFPSRYEGFGLAAAEAMATGLPVIGFPVGFLEKLYSASPFSPLLIPFALSGKDDAVQCIRESVENLLLREDFMREISEKGRDIITKNYHSGIWRQRIKSVLCLD